LLGFGARGKIMKAFDTLDATRLLGFASLGDRLVNGVDFKDDILGARLGAKVGFPEHPQLDFSRLLGFASLGDQKNVDFRDEVFDGKLGAKVGVGEWAVCDHPSESDHRADQGLALRPLRPLYRAHCAQAARFA
jgi:hypothetical protein